MDKKYLHAFNLAPGVSGRTIGILLERFGNAEGAWNASENDILFCADIDAKAKDAVLCGRKNIDPDKEWESFLSLGISALAKSDPLYPSLLQQIPDAPCLLYVRGAYDFALERPMIAIVGSRKHTSYGEQASYRLAEDLARAGVIVVSGLAYGIDALAHKAALEAGAETLAVMGNGLADRSLYPRAHVPLAQRIAEQGALISEYPPDTRANSYTFPARNRIIAGMTLGTVVIEAAEESGSLITASLALDYNREVFAVPGSIFSLASFGTNRLLRQGAKIVTSVRDILEEFPGLAREETLSPAPGAAVPKNLSSEEEKILALLSHEPLHVDKIIKAATLETATVNSLLALLEIKGLAKNIGSMNYIRI